MLNAVKNGSLIRHVTSQIRHSLVVPPPPKKNPGSAPVLVDHLKGQINTAWACDTDMHMLRSCDVTCELKL